MFSHCSSIFSLQNSLILPAWRVNSSELDDLISEIDMEGVATLLLSSSSCVPLVFFSFHFLSMSTVCSRARVFDVRPVLADFQSRREQMIPMIRKQAQDLLERKKMFPSMSMNSAPTVLAELAQACVMQHVYGNMSAPETQPISSQSGWWSSVKNALSWR